MSVLIKGMRMPHDCFECPLAIPPIWDYSPLWMCGGNGMKVHEASIEEHRPFGCPLAEVSEDVVSPYEVCPLVKVEEPRYCDRNICVTNEYNGIECENCEVTLHNKKVKEAVPYCTEENCPIYQSDLSCERCNR